MLSVLNQAVADPTTTSALVSASASRVLTRAEFHGLAEMPAELEWFANIDNPRTRRAYRNDIEEFSRFVGIAKPEEMRSVTRSHLIAWRKQLKLRNLTGSTIRRKLSAVASLFDSLCKRNAVTHNPVRGVKRPRVDGNEGKTPALSDGQARALLEAPSPETLKGKRDRAIIATFLHHGLRCEELCKLAVRDIHDRQGVAHFRVHVKGSKIRYIPLHPIALQRIQEYLAAAGHAEETAGPLFRPVKNPSEKGDISHALTHPAIYPCVLRKYARAIGIGGVHLGPHSLRATAATNALDRGSDLAKVQEWLGHANVATTRLYDRRRSRPEDSPTYRISY
jgi:integrase/recombinase XerD